MMIACGRIAIVPVVDVVVVVQVDEPENLEQTGINHNHVITDHMIMVGFRFFPLAQPRPQYHNDQWTNGKPLGLLFALYNTIWY